MNAARRKQVQKARDLLEEARDDEQLAFDNLPENFQYGEQGEEMEDHIANLEDALCSIDEVTE